MARTHGGGSQVFIDEWDFSGVINSVATDRSRPVADITAFLDPDAVSVAGKASFSVTLNGLYSTASPAYDGEMFTDLTSSNRLITVSPGIALATGGRAKFGRGNITNMPIISNITDAVLLNVTWNGNEVLVNGICGFRGATESASATATAYQLGALSATQQMIAFLHVISGSAGTLDVKITSDSAEAFNVTPADEITFTQASGATSERKTVDGAVTDDWWRVEYTIAGGGTWSFLVVLGVANL